MNGPRRLAALLLSLSGALLLASCHHVDPKTAVAGPVTCERETTDRKCDACTKSACCAEYQACALGAPCPCYLLGRVKAWPSATTLDFCGPPNAAYIAFASCVDTHCADACPVDDPRVHHRLIGRPAPEIVAEVVGGEGPKTLQAALGRVVIVEFWATWCPSCKRAFPKLQEIVDSFHGDVAVLAIDVEDRGAVEAPQILEFAKDHDGKFPVLWDATHRTARTYRAPTVLPSAFVVDQRGTVRSLHMGYDPRLVDEVKALLGSPPPPPSPHGDSPP